MAKILKFRYGTLLVTSINKSGQETFRSLVSAYYHSADAILIVYDVTFAKSFAVHFFIYRVLSSTGSNKQRITIKIVL